MKVIDLIQEIEDILETAGGFPLTGKVMVDPGEIRDILKEIRQELPEEIQQAQWIKNERQRILDDAKRSTTALSASRMKSRSSWWKMTPSRCGRRNVPTRSCG